MPAQRGIPAPEGRAALEAWAADPTSAPRDVLGVAVRFTLGLLAQAHPGHAVEVRVPPYGAVQCLEGVRHRRGTPPNVIETDAVTWLRLATGELTWTDAVAAAVVAASGDRADLSGLLPIVGNI